ncbi:putative ribonuclease H-like domain, reverse transcriptase zinc-binding domain-containing protein [Rosa chinensis]|uniref:Putative ribonuclease H-like domain, reverse transcriptase zinc-binding domain-containing protein n=1 Tax=Rosa chinensis TaxID=74649 RepID=A0A2P6QAC1_ROSCH|nr:putative ribonuclease H-like domain, reverse transcriptase zinc-binding domain-containing protein [Rosa chinensis]
MHSRSLTMSSLIEGHQLGSSLLGKAQGFYVASSKDGSSQTIAFTAMFESGGYWSRKEKKTIGLRLFWKRYTKILIDNTDYKKLNTASSSASEQRGPLRKYWTKIWHANVPPKIKVLVWCLVHGIVPTRLALLSRHLHIQDVACVFCKSTNESSLHVFKECDALQCFWRLGPLKLKAKEHAAGDLKNWLFDVLDMLNSNQVDFFFMALWSVWTERNKIVWNDGCFQPMHMIQYGLGGIGVVVRDDLGTGIAAIAKPFLHAHSAINMEAEACRAGLLLGIHQGWSDVVIESDSALLIATLKSEEDNFSEVSRVFDDCTDYLSDFQSIEIRHIYREANGVAHRLAHLASYLLLDDVWLDETPAIIQDVLYENYCNASISHLAVMGGTRKYLNAKGYGVVKTINGVNGQNTDGIDTILQFTVYLSY